MTMKKFINQPERFIDEMLYGLYAAHPSYYTCVNEDAHCLITKHKIAGKVGIATGGGSGHLPLFLGYVGKGMLDGCSVGDVFQSPSSEQMLDVTKAIDSGAGVLYIFGNYNGDIFNFQMAAEMAEMEEDIEVRLSIAGPCTVPRIGHPSFTIADDEMEIGMGIHGEAGLRRGKICSADDIIKEIVPPVMQDLQLRHDDEVCVLINGLGATPLEEQYLITGLVHRLLKDAGIRVHRTYVGEYATSLEMTGLSISLLKVDEELKRLMDAAADTPMFKQFGESK